jgi:RND superfamily putative drug exporter
MIHAEPEFRFCYNMNFRSVTPRSFPVSTDPQLQSAGHHNRHEGALARLGRASARHGWRTVLAWVAATVAIIAATATFGGTLVDEFTIPNSDAQRAVDLLEQRFPARAGDSATVVLAVNGGTLSGAASRAAVEQALEAAKQIPGVKSVGDPFAADGGDVSADGRIAYADVQFSKPAFEVPAASIDRLEHDVAAAVDGTPVTAEFTGSVILNSETPETGVSELLGLAAAMVILLVVFGSVVAMGLPILLALVSVGIGLALLLLGASLTNFNTITPTLATMIGLGVGIDYALFIVTRFRQALHDGLSSEDAAAAAVSTAGRAVIFAGTTVAISISALAVVGLDFITKLGIGAAITVVVAVIAAITLLPAVLSLLGERVDKGRLPFIREADDSQTARQNSFSARWARVVTRRPLVSTVAALAVLATLALPVAWIHLGAADAGSNATSSTTRRAYDLLAEGFGPGFNGPLLIAVDQRSAPGTAERLAAVIRDVPGVASVAKPAVNDAGDAAQLIVYPATAPDSEATQHLVDRLRSDTLPGALVRTDAQAYVGGSTAAFEDIAAKILGRFPLFLLVAVGITFLMISMAFRSVVVALKAALTTMLSALAAAGVLVAVFQFGWGQSLIGLDSTGPIESFLPVIVFAILFGLSMDYEVFLVSRIREEYVHGDAARPAIVDGMGAIGRVVVAAGAIMTVVFFSFVLGPDRAIKEFGVALGAAIAIDAFLVRLVLVPAVMWLLDERAWYMPRWLDRILPNLTIEPPVTAESDDAPPAAEPAYAVGGGRR